MQVRLTTSGSVSTLLTATVTIGGTSAGWQVTALAGSLEGFKTASTYAGTYIATGKRVPTAEEHDAVLAAVKDAVRRCAVACGHP